MNEGKTIMTFGYECHASAFFLRIKSVLDLTRPHSLTAEVVLAFVQDHLLFAPRTHNTAARRTLAGANLCHKLTFVIFGNFIRHLVWFDLEVLSTRVWALKILVHIFTGLALHGRDKAKLE